jgi:UDP-glucose:glycoprotein glucosyltransferase
VRRERALIGVLAGLGLGRGEALAVLTHEGVSGALGDGGGGALDGIFAASDRNEGGERLVWWNDIEKDSRWMLACFFFSLWGELINANG